MFSLPSTIVKKKLSAKFLFVPLLSLLNTVSYIISFISSKLFSSLNREFFSDVAWTLSMYLEAVAMLPQIYMFQKQASDQGGIVEVRKYYVGKIGKVSLN